MARSVSNRLLVSELDSMAQAAVWRSAADVGERAAAVRRFVAVLRLARLLADDLLISDAQLLDGVFFQHLGPLGVRGALALGPTDPLPFTVLAAADTLEASYQGMLARGDGFTWSSRGLHDAGTEQAALEAWAQEERSGTLAVVRRSGTLDVAAQLGPRPQGGEVVARAVEGSAGRPPVVHRSQLLELVGSARARQEIDDDEAAALVRWWSDAYFDAIAEQNDAWWLEIGARRAAPRTQGVDGELLGTLERMGPSVFALIELRSGARSPHAEGRHLRDVALAVRQTTEPTQGWGWALAWTTARLVAAVSAVVLATVVDLTQATTWIVVALIAALSLPYEHIADLWRLRRSAIDVVVHEV